MIHISRIQLLTLSVVAAVTFSITHAKDISAAVSFASVAGATQLKTIDNGIHLDLHTHVDRQSLKTLLQSAQQDRPQAQERSLRKALAGVEKRENKLPDGKLGQYIPI